MFARSFIYIFDLVFPRGLYVLSVESRAQILFILTQATIGQLICIKVNRKVRNNLVINKHNLLYLSK